MGMEAEERNQPAKMGFRKSSPALFWHNIGDKGDREAYFPVEDNGCEFSPRCVDCPLVECRHDYEGLNDMSGAALAIDATIKAGLDLPDEVTAWVRKYCSGGGFVGEAGLTARKLYRMVGQDLHLSDAEKVHTKKLARQGLSPRTIARRLFVKERVVTKFLKRATL